MASIEIILRDDEGNIINQKTQKRYALSLDNGRIGEIEVAVEGLKRESLPDMTYDVLAHAQQQQIEQIKKPNRCHVTGRVRSQSRRRMANLPFRINGLRIEQARRTSVGSNIRSNFARVMKVSGYGRGGVMMPTG